MKLEADFRQYYQLDIRLLFVPGSVLNFRQASDLMEMLPPESRFMKHVRDDALDIDQHMLMNLQDLLARIEFQTAIAAQVAAGKEYKKALKHMPKISERPTIKAKVKEPKKFVKTSDLMKMFGGNTLKSRKE